VKISQYKQKYRVESIRLQDRDYGANGWYYITIRTHEGNHYFGEINNDSMMLSVSGEIAQRIWKIIPDYFSYIELDEMIIMPNHIHGILHINNERDHNRDAINRVSTCNDKKFTFGNNGGITGKMNPMLSNNLSRVIRWYKGRVKYETGKSNMDFKWHPRFYDRILRLNTDELNIKRNYIRNNVKNWIRDT
jgi:REP element-mobilizing transposase RayT